MFTPSVKWGNHNLIKYKLYSNRESISDHARATCSLNPNFSISKRLTILFKSQSLTINTQDQFARTARLPKPQHPMLNQIEMEQTHSTSTYLSLYLLDWNSIFASVIPTPTIFTRSNPHPQAPSTSSLPLKYSPFLSSFSQFSVNPGL